MTALTPADLSLFESQHAGPHSTQHIRIVDEAGLFLGGGHTAGTLCARVMTGWDLEGGVTVDAITHAQRHAPDPGPTPMCGVCGVRALQLLDAGDADPAPSDGVG